MAVVSKNFDADYGANGNGAGNNDNAQEARAFRDAMFAAQGSDSIELSLTAAAAYWFGTSQGPSPTNNGFLAGLKDATVIGNGATLTSTSGWGYQFGGRGQIQNASNSAMIETVLVGSRRVQVVAAHSSKMSLFVVGRWLCVTGVDIQGLWNSPYGFPSNQAFHDFAEILDVNATTRVIILDRPLRNSYKSTWPRYNSGSAFEVDNGGPATIYAFDAWWDAKNRIEDVICTQTTQINGKLRELTLDGCSFTSGSAGSFPSENLIYRAKGCDFSLQSVEVDKLCRTIIYDDTDIRRLDFQSTSNDVAVVLASDVSLFFDGTPKKAILRGRKADGSRSTIVSLRPGAWAYGCSDELDCEGYDIAAFTFGGHLTTIGASWTMTDGVIRVPNTDITGSGPVSRVLIPGKYFFWRRTTSPAIFEVARGGQVTDVTQDGTYVYFHTNLSGGFPSSLLSIRSHSAPRFRMRDCIGTADILDFCGAPEWAPLFSYSSRSHAPSASGSQGARRLWGDIASIKINVTTPAIGTGSATLNLFAQFSSVSVFILADHTIASWFPVVNLKVAGERVITPSGVTGTQSGDTNLTMPNSSMWVGYSPNPFYTKTGTVTAPEFSIEFTLDPGFDSDDTKPAFESKYARF